MASWVRRIVRGTGGRAAVSLFPLVLFLGGCGDGPGPGVPGGAWSHLLSPGQGRFFHVSSYDTTGGNRDRYELAPGDSVLLLDLEGPGVIRQLWITVASPDPDYLRRISLMMFWDGEDIPSVEVPLGDFFGNGFVKAHYTALPMGVSSGGFYSYLPMPFQRRARILAVNGTGQVVDAFYFNANVEEGVELPRPLATFHAVWNRNPRTTSLQPHRLLDAEVRNSAVKALTGKKEGAQDALAAMLPEDTLRKEAARALHLLHHMN